LEEKEEGMMMHRLVAFAGVAATMTVAAAAQVIPEISAGCEAQNARVSAIVQRECLPLGSIDAKLACGKRVRAEQHADPNCIAETRAHLVALNHACLAGTAPATFERSGVCATFRDHPTAYAK
jgi:hypothetical protein